MLKTEIFYFSGTGNTLALAKNLAAKLGDTKVSSITALRGQSVQVTTPTVGIVFPVYAFGLPRIVSRFVEQLELPPNSFLLYAIQEGRQGIRLNNYSAYSKQRTSRLLAL